MKINELFELLETAIEAGMGDQEIRVATQPNYPLEGEIDGAGFTAEIDECECDEDGDETCNCTTDDKFWILISDGKGYASRSLWDGELRDWANER